MYNVGIMFHRLMLDHPQNFVVLFHNFQRIGGHYNISGDITIVSVKRAYMKSYLE